MLDYEKILNKAELALNNGEYKYCIDLLNPYLKEFPVSTSKGVNIRMMLITALSGINKKEESIKICKQLIKSRDRNIRDEAKSLIQILDSPNLRIPDNWNIKFEDSFTSEKINHSTSKNQPINQSKQYINISNLPTGETKPFQKGFIVFTFILSLLLLSLLSGCVKVENNLDLREINSINYELKLDSKYISKIPWQLNFERKLKKISLRKDIYSNDENFTLKKNGLDIEGVRSYINQILKIVSNTIEIDLKDIKIDQFEKNYYLGKKYFFNIEFNLINLKNFDDLDISINIINPTKVMLLKENKNVNLFERKITWKILPGKINQIEFSFWHWNRILIWTFMVIILIIIAYYIRNKRYALGSNLPQLPS